MNTHRNAIPPLVVCESGCVCDALLCFDVVVVAVTVSCLSCMFAGTIFGILGGSFFLVSLGNHMIRIHFFCALGGTVFVVPWWSTCVG